MCAVVGHCADGHAVMGDGRGAVGSAVGFDACPEADLEAGIEAGCAVGGDTGCAIVLGIGCAIDRDAGHDDGHAASHMYDLIPGLVIGCVGGCIADRTIDLDSTDLATGLVIFETSALVLVLTVSMDFC